eukprot:3791405-Lingulodinium_polyedra.AAC.2
MPSKGIFADFSTEGFMTQKFEFTGHMLTQATTPRDAKFYCAGPVEIESEAPRQPDEFPLNFYVVQPVMGKVPPVWHARVLPEKKKDPHHGLARRDPHLAFVG